MTTDEAKAVLEKTANPFGWADIETIRSLREALAFALGENERLVKQRDAVLGDEGREWVEKCLYAAKFYAADRQFYLETASLRMAAYIERQAASNAETAERERDALAKAVKDALQKAEQFIVNGVGLGFQITRRPEIGTIFTWFSRVSSDPLK